MNRRDFLKMFFAASFCQALPSKALIFEMDDKKIFESKMALAERAGWHSLPLNQILLLFAESFLGAPYVANTLEKNHEEQLIINLRQLDCLTFIENTLALALCFKQRQFSFNDFCQKIQFIRYRQGSLNGYASRLHYFTDWLADAEEKNILKNIPGTKFEKKKINILSSRRKGKEDFNFIEYTEKHLSEKGFAYFPSQALNTGLHPQFYPGDIIGFSSNIEGLDINHVAFLWPSKHHSWTFIHASSLNKKVEIYEKTLTEYCQNFKKNTGIVLARVNNSSFQ